jgi:hypothetical protein
MPIHEDQQEVWSRQGSVQQSASTYASIKRVLEDSDSPYYLKNFDSFLQGSYGNDTNIYADSDVDIVMRLTSVYYPDITQLFGDDLGRYEAARSKASYTLEEFKSDVTDWLRRSFGNDVTAGKKAIYIPGNNNRRDADVLACAEHRKFLTYPAHGDPTFHEGIMFITSDGTRIINYPKQHSANCTAKHQATNGYFKPTVRIFKNMRNRMRENNLIEDGLAPSYFLEGLLSNVPNRYFETSYADTMVNAVNYILQADRSQFMCVNGIHQLLQEGSPTSWRAAACDRFMQQVVNHWKNR